MDGGESPRRIAVVVHPSRPLDKVLGTLTAWAERNRMELVQLRLDGNERSVFPEAGAERGDLVAALGGDGTTLAALRAAAAVDAPVLGVACGSVGALTAVSADRLTAALDRMRAGDWTARALPALAVAGADTADWWALNDFVIVRRGSGQVIVDISVDGEEYVGLAGDGLIVATPLGSSGYNIAAGGPLVAGHTAAYVCTPLAMHGGSAAPLVVPGAAVVTVEVRPTYGGFDVEIDGRRRTTAASSFELTLQESKVRLVTFARAGAGLGRLRERGLIADSPRVLVQDRRAQSPT